MQTGTPYSVCRILPISTSNTHARIAATSYFVVVEAPNGRVIDTATRNQTDTGGNLQSKRGSKPRPLTTPTICPNEWSVCGGRKRSRSTTRLVRRALLQIWICLPILSGRSRRPICSFDSRKRACSLFRSRASCEPVLIKEWFIRGVDGPSENRVRSVWVCDMVTDTIVRKAFWGDLYVFGFCSEWGEFWKLGGGKMNVGTVCANDLIYSVWTALNT